MSLIKKQSMTEKNLAAHRRNAKLSPGHVTPEGKARCQDASLRHGLYSKSEQAVLRKLGEDPADFQAVLEGLRATWAPETPAQEKVITCLAQTLCRIELAEHARQGHLLRQAKEADDGRETRLHAQMMHLKMTADSLRLLGQSVAQKHYVASLDDLKKMKSLHQEGAMKEMGEIAVALIFQLRQPGTPGLGEPGECEDQEEKRHRVMNKIRAIFGLSPLPEEEEPVNPDMQTALASQQDIDGSETDADPLSLAGQGLTGETEVGPEVIPADWCQKIGATNPREVGKPELYPKITQEQWEAREPVRQLLENILTHQVDIYEARRQALLKELVAGPSPYERAAETLPPDSYVKLMQRVEDSNLRQASRLITLLEKMKRQARAERARKRPAATGYVAHKKRG